MDFHTFTAITRHNFVKHLNIQYKDQIIIIISRLTSQFYLEVNRYTRFHLKIKQATVQKIFVLSIKSVFYFIYHLKLN